MGLVDLKSSISGEIGFPISPRREALLVRKEKGITGCISKPRLRQGSSGRLGVKCEPNCSLFFFPKSGTDVDQDIPGEHAFTVLVSRNPQVSNLFRHAVILDGLMCNVNLGMASVPMQFVVQCYEAVVFDKTHL